MGKKYFNVTYRVSENIWSANLAHAENADDVRTFYDRNEDVRGDDIIIADADEYAVEDAQRRHKPIVEVELKQPAAVKKAVENVKHAAAKKAAKRADYISTVTTCGNCFVAVVNGSSMDAVNAYMVKHFDVVPGADFTVTTAPAVADVVNLGTFPHMFTTRAPSRKAVDSIVRSYGVHISEGNMKMGRIASISLAPGKTCSPDACRTCLQEGCYACKSYRLYPETRAAWDANTVTALSRLQCMQYGAALYLRHRAPRFFRFHVGGDFVTREYAAAVAAVADWFPGTKFLAFTKQFVNVRGIDFPENFTLRLSDWPGIEIPADLRARYRVAWLDDGTRPAETFPADALECPGNCETCGACWNLDRDTIFHKH